MRARCLRQQEGYPPRCNGFGGQRVGMVDRELIRLSVSASIRAISAASRVYPDALSDSRGSGGCSRQRRKPIPDPNSKLRLLKRRVSGEKELTPMVPGAPQDVRAYPVLSNYRADRNAASSAAVEISDIRQPTRGAGPWPVSILTHGIRSASRNAPTSSNTWLCYV